MVEGAADAGATVAIVRRDFLERRGEEETKVDFRKAAVVTRRVNSGKHLIPLTRLRLALKPSPPNPPATHDDGELSFLCSLRCRH